MTDLSGIWLCDIDGETGYVYLPGTLDENHIGYADRITASWHPDAAIPTEDGTAGLILTRLTRQFRYEGQVSLTRHISIHVLPGKRYFIEAERARMLELIVNGTRIHPFVPGTLSTPWLFEVTDALTGNDTITFISDNTYTGLPGDAIRYSSAASDETQTNWNGILGRFRLYDTSPCFVHHVGVYPGKDSISLRITLSTDGAWAGTILIEGKPLQFPVRLDASVSSAGLTEIMTGPIPVSPDVPRWDIGSGGGQLLSLRVTPDGMDAVQVSFGLRTFSAMNGRFMLNDIPIFLMGDTNCAIFPETGYPPMTIPEWTRILRQYMDCGINCLRFHSHVPPEAAFTAADELGLLLQPELSHWDPRSAFSTMESREYYLRELMETLRMLANHPSFVMLTLGNELHYSNDCEAFVSELLNRARAFDPTRLYAAGSNNFYGVKGCDPASDFFMSCAFYDAALRATNSGMTGPLNETSPGMFTYDETIRRIRRETDQPVISFEVGQYEMLPDFDQLARFQGITRPDNLTAMRDLAAQNGLISDWPKRVEASSIHALRCYRDEIEAAMLTHGLAGISLLSLQDFTGQGTALVGILDAHLIPKNYGFDIIQSFRDFFADCRPIPCLRRYTYYDDEPLETEIRIVNHSRKTLQGNVVVSLNTSQEQVIGEFAVPAGEIRSAGTVSFTFPAGHGLPSAWTLTVHFAGYSYETTIWSFSRETVPCPQDVLVTKVLNDAALFVLKQGGRVYLVPDSTKDSLPGSVQEHYTTNFWSVGTFPDQTGGMGLMIDSEHPLFNHFCTGVATDPHWWPMAGRRAFVLPEGVRSIITQLDCPQRMRNLGMLLEGKCLNGQILISSMDLDTLPYPEARGLQNAIYRYLGSDRFQPSQVLPPELIRSLVSGT